LETSATKVAPSAATAANFGFEMPKVLIVEFCALKREVYRQVKILTLCSSSSFFSKKYQK
jgi:hypothetical protein